jgi:hypothetical protein
MQSRGERRLVASVPHCWMAPSKSRFGDTIPTSLPSISILKPSHSMSPPRLCMLSEPASARGVPEQMNEIQHAACSPQPRLGDPGYALAEDLPLRVAIAAPKTRNP